jgi:pilus assembly protein CpaF
MLQAMNTGHDGSLTTVHANSPRDSIARLETMTLMAGMELPVRAIREQIASAVDVIVHLTRLRDGTRRVTHLTEVVGMEGDTVVMQDLFVFDHRAGLDQYGRDQGQLHSTGVRPRFLDILADHGIAISHEMFSANGRPRAGKGA